MNKQEIILAELPFLSIQGEGNTVGKISTFIRFQGCNYRCNFCDSKFTWDSTKNKELVIYNSVSEFVENNIDLLVRHNSQNVVFTGGEPLLYQHQIVDIINEIEIAKNASFINTQQLNTYEIETNFAEKLEEPFVQYFYSYGFLQFNISPKLQFSSPEQLKDNFRLLKKYKVTNFILKFVDDQTEETRKKIIDMVDFVKDIFNNISFYIHENVYIMPEGETREKQLNKFESTLDFCKEHEFNFSPRLHVLLWDNKKGV